MSEEQMKYYPTFHSTSNAIIKSYILYFSRCCYANCDGMLFFSLWCSERRRKRSQHVTTKVMYIYVNITTDLGKPINVRIFLYVISYKCFYLRNAVFCFIP